ncbi:uncharacterized protein LOC119096356 isoform X2 [Pollicipes pollicipes]|uniref:uncharacterized protein LOC119096356 isoform X2 n=1 Tax=Pollicipes pollicipes TaxID=41117 RepID=UPI0018854568|nr:uncharacterized protein LOC119096356 isoform X2 [Pollicipes pollicipes]
MTVLTKVKVSKKDDEPVQTHLVEEKTEDDLENEAAASDEVDAEAVRYMVLSQRARRINSSSICVLTAILLTFSLCIVCGIFYYQHKKMPLHAWCSIPYQGRTNNDDLLRPDLSDVELFNPKGGADRAAEPIQMLPVFHEEFDIDVEENMETMFVPEFEWGQSAHFVNDFTAAQTVIVPEGDARLPCLLMELDMRTFLEPGPLAERVRRMENGDDQPDPTLVTQETMSIRLPALTDGVSSHIRRACAGVAIFALERRNVFKRSADGERTGSAKFAVYGGRGIVQYTITNLADAV